MAWYSLTVDVPEKKLEHVQQLMFDHGAAGLEFRDANNPVMPGFRAPPPGVAIVVGSFDSKRKLELAKARIQKDVPSSVAQSEDVVERDWSTEWRSRIRSVSVGRLWVGPPWEKKKAPKNKVCLFIEPKMAFGTGDHPTTSLCLKAVDAFLATAHKPTVLDVGTGTGVLAFAAKKLGAGRTVAIDNDPVSVELAIECAAENDITGVELSTKTLDEIDGPFDLVVANILANTLIELAPLIVPKVKKHLVLAGILVHQGDDVRRAYEALGMTSSGSEIQGEWVRLDLDAAPAATRPAKKAAPKRAKKPKNPVYARAAAKLSRARRA